VDRIPNNINELKELMEKMFSRPHPLIPLSLVRRGGTKGGEVKRSNFTLYSKGNSPAQMYTHAHSCGP
jgi:hypothetical protein